MGRREKPRESMPDSRGRFIVIEGLDGAGTTTQSGMLTEYFTRRRTNSFRTFEPTDAPIGKFIREILTHRIPVQHASGYMSEHVMSLLFAADRLGHSARIRELIDSGRHVVCDRYIYSSLAYQTLDPEIAPEWVVDINRGCAVPDATLFISVPVDTCMERITARGDEGTVYERKDFLETIDRNYARLRGLYEDRFGTTIDIDGTQPPEAVHADLIAAVQSRFGW